MNFIILPMNFNEFVLNWSLVMMSQQGLCKKVPQGRKDDSCQGTFNSKK
jgi:hypothetical protein